MSPALLIRIKFQKSIKMKIEIGSFSAFVNSIPDDLRHELKYVPCFVTNVEAHCMKSTINKNWKGQFYATEKMRSYIERNRPATCIGPISSNLPKITAFTSKNTSSTQDLCNTIFLLESLVSRCILLTSNENCMQIIVQNPLLRSEIQDGIDVLYVDNGNFHIKREKQNISEEDCHLLNIATAIRPAVIIDGHHLLPTLENMPHILNVLETP